MATEAPRKDRRIILNAMTEDEHRLILSLLVQREIRFKALLELLRSQATEVNVDDLAGFESLVRSKMQDDVTAAVLEEYKTLAKSLGLQKDLPKPEPY